MMPRTESARRKAAPPKRIAPADWKWIEREYRGGVKSCRTIAAESTAKGAKISHVAIEKRAKRYGWTRELAADVRKEIRNRLVTQAVNKSNASTTEEIIDAAARQGVEVVRQHRTVIDRGRRIVETMLGQLEAATDNAADLEALAAEETAAKPDASKAEIESAVARRARLMRSIGLASRASIVRDLSHAARNWIGLERTAFNLNDKDVAPDSIEERLSRIEDADRCA